MPFFDQEIDKIWITSSKSSHNDVRRQLRAKLTSLSILIQNKTTIQRQERPPRAGPRHGYSWDKSKFLNSSSLMLLSKVDRSAGLTSLILALRASIKAE